MFKSYKSKKPKASHPWKQAAKIAVEEKRERLRVGEGEWRNECLARRDRIVGFDGRLARA